MPGMVGIAAIPNRIARSMDAIPVAINDSVTRTDR